MNDVLLCPFDGKRCSFPDGEHFKSADFCGCWVYRGRGVRWVCPRFPDGMSITAVRDVFTRFYERMKHERKRMRTTA